MILNNRIHNIILTVLALIPLSIYAQDDECNSDTLKSGIKSVRLHPVGNPLSFPNIQLSGQKLHFEFDDLDDIPRNLFYRFKICDRDSSELSLLDSEFLNGINRVPFPSSKVSIGTTTPYLQYATQFPNQDISFRLPGLYKIEVFDELDEQTILVEAYFLLFQRVGNFDFRIEDHALGNGNNPRLEIVAALKDMPANKMGLDYFLEVRQNNHRVLTRTKADYVSNNNLGFLNPSLMEIKLGNEFRSLNIKSIDYRMDNVLRITRNKNDICVFMRPDEIRSNSSASTTGDIDGQSYIQTTDGFKEHLEADYWLIHFAFNIHFPLKDGTVHVIGAATGWEPNDQNQLTFNPETNRYEIKYLLKQGMHDYIYVFKYKTGQLQYYVFQGNHPITQNSYQAILYLFDPVNAYYQPVGYITHKY